MVHFLYFINKLPFPVRHHSMVNLWLVAKLGNRPPKCHMVSHDLARSDKLKYH